MRIHTLFATVPVAALLVSMTGCTTRSATFEGYADDQVWSAMVAAARTPEYDDWKVQDNEVMVDESGKRLEIYRYLKRLYVTPFADPQKEQEEWRLQIVLSRDASLDAPTVDFTARQVSVPAHVWREADRYFAQVRTLLGPPTAKDAAKDAAEDAANDAAAPSEGGTPVPPPLPDDATRSTPANPTPAGEAAGQAPAGAESPSAAPPETLPER